MKNKIQIWGSLPEPYGGVSVHVQRLIQSMSHIEGISLLNFSKGPQIIRGQNIRKSRGFFLEFCTVIFSTRTIVHLHTNNWYVLKLFSFFKRNSFMVTLHNKRFLNSSSRDRVIKVLKTAQIVFSNDMEVYKALKENNVKAINAPAFLPPIINNKPYLPSEFKSFKDSKTLLFSMSIYGFNFLTGDDYGLKRALSLLINYRDINIGLCLCISQPNFKELEAFKSELVKNGLEDKVLLLVNKVTNGSDIWSNSDAFLRLNNTDIEGLSVKEALMLNIPVLASDVCSRPRDTIVFNHNDQEDLDRKFLDLIKNNQLLKEKLRSSPKSDIISATDIIIPIYKKIIQ